MNAQGQAKIVAQAIKAILRERGLDVHRAIEPIWSEIATADTYGTEEKFFVWWIRSVERRGTGDYWFKRVRRLTYEN